MHQPVWLPPQQAVRGRSVPGARAGAGVVGGSQLQHSQRAARGQRRAHRPVRVTDRGLGHQQLVLVKEVKHPAFE